MIKQRHWQNNAHVFKGVLYTAGTWGPILCLTERLSCRDLLSELEIDNITYNVREETFCILLSFNMAGF